MAESRRFRNRIVESPFSRIAALGPRSAVCVRHIGRQIRLVIGWLVHSREHTNYTYDLTENNCQQLVWFVSAVTGQKFDVIRAYVEELTTNRLVQSTYSEALSRSPRRGLADNQIRFGRRLAWYAFVRALKPDLVVETGTDKGLGSLVLASALLMNQRGRLVTIDVNPAAGYLITGPYSEVTTVLHGDSIDLIRALTDPVDLFLHDSDHSPEHERAEFAALESHLHAGSLIISDNAHATGVLATWALKHDRRFLFFAEEPQEHWYRGAGIGAAW